MTVRDYKELRVWQKAIDLVALIYSTTQAFPDQERYGLKSQLRRAAVSIPGNIAEGQGRATTGEFQHFLGIARGSLYEVETQVHIAERLRLVTKEESQEVMKLFTDVVKMLNALINALPKRA